MSRKARNVFNVLIKGAKWKVRLLKHSEYMKLPKEKIGEYDIAYCDDAERELVFNLVNLSRGVIRHELLHAYVAEANIESTTSLTIIDMEEICCSILQNQFDDIQKLTDKIIMEAMKHLGELK
jgi:hypothetical protein